MSYSLNRAQIIGNLTRDPEVRIAGSTKVASFGVATNLTWTDKSGEKKEKVEFHNIVAWRGLAEISEKYLRKGRKVYVEGRLQTHDWQGQDGVKRYRTEIVADNLILLDRPGTGPDTSREHAGLDKQDAPAEKDNAVASGATSEEEISIDDLPF